MAGAWLEAPSADVLHERCWSPGKSMANCREAVRLKTDNPSKKRLRCIGIGTGIGMDIGRGWLSFSFRLAFL